ncbi:MULTISPECIES: heavy-metal-associated domain-containing protein [Nocardia]|uniref:heavy-metal-associated domain-containing protein n=1 Tax=Nocardia TaxID=1817 RepID=UPI0012F4A27B|nr:heavy metal-associated domain-containing protein [Nocardia pseudovaccinii]
MTYTFDMTDYSDERAVVAERALYNLGGVQSVDVDRTSETITVNSTLSYGEVLDAIRSVGVGAK